ncbi:hypothetical protein L1987_89627 [Smallanthus sonchifolius]|nr:hypothetical protein L1987_89627 [Smallanthus sonchifolius]
MIWFRTGIRSPATNGNGRDQGLVFNQRKLTLGKAKWLLLLKHRIRHRRAGMQESAKICNASSISIPHSYSDYILKGGNGRKTSGRALVAEKASARRSKLSGETIHCPSSKGSSVRPTASLESIGVQSGDQGRYAPESKKSLNPGLSSIAYSKTKTAATLASVCSYSEDRGIPGGLDVQFPLPCKVLSHLEGQAMECGRYKPGQWCISPPTTINPLLGRNSSVFRCSLSRMCYVYQSDKDQSDGLFSLRKKERSEVMQNKQQQRIQAPSIDGELIKEQIHKHRHTMQCFTRFSGTPSSEGSESIIQAYESGTTGINYKANETERS